MRCFSWIYYVFLVPLVIACTNDTSSPISGNANTEPACGDGADASTCADGIQNQAETGIECGGPCVACSVLAAGQFTDPGALDSKEELDFVKAQIQVGAQPWKGEYDKLLGSAQARRRPHGLINIDSDGSDANTSRDDAIAAYAQALLW